MDELQDPYLKLFSGQSHQELLLTTFRSTGRNMRETGIRNRRGIQSLNIKSTYF